MAGIASFRTLVTGEGALPQRWKNGGGSLSSSTSGLNGITPSKFLSVIGLDDGCKFEGVFLNGLRSLRRFSLKNITGTIEGVPASPLVSFFRELYETDSFFSRNLSFPSYWTRSNFGLLTAPLFF